MMWEGERERQEEEKEVKERYEMGEGGEGEADIWRRGKTLENKRKTKV